MITERQEKHIRSTLIYKDLTVCNLAKTIGISRQYLNLIMTRKVENLEKEKAILDWLLKTM